MAQVSDRCVLEALLQDEKAMPRSISLSLLREITRDFSVDKKIGGGGFGDVYKGVVGDGYVAVKKLRSSLTIEDTTFRREVDCLTAVQHRNIVRFIGYCADTSMQRVNLSNGRTVTAESRERLFCLEYIPKGSLNNHLTFEDGSCVFSWHVCFEIIKGICQGLCHLHEKKRIIHLDLKPHNILLDNGMVPKITDFGLSRLLGEDRSRTITKEVIGSLGYMAPEYRDHGVITFKADIYSLGVIIKRMVAGDNTEQAIENVAQNWWRRIESGMAGMHTSWEALYNQVKACIELSKICTQSDRNKRPDILDIIHRLDETTRRNHSSSNNIDTSKVITGANHHMLPSRSLKIEWSDSPRYWRWSFFQGSRFPECAELLTVYFLAITGEIPTKDLSPDTGYTVYLIYKLARDSTGFHAGQQSSIRLYNERIVETKKVSLDPRALEIHGATYPKARGNGWMELKLAEFHPNDTRLVNEEAVIVDIREVNTDYMKKGIIIEGMEFRPNSG